MNDETIEVRGALTLRHCEDFGDWYIIERAKHDGRVWLEPTEYGASLRSSARISDADVEGTAADMLAIADAIEARGEYSAKRCSVDAVGADVLFCSPRNSTVDARVPRVVAAALAQEIRAKLGAGAAATP
jgi:hypothetical protein